MSDFIASLCCDKLFFSSITWTQVLPLEQMGYRLLIVIEHVFVPASTPSRSTDCHPSRSLRPECQDYGRSGSTQNSMLGRNDVNDAITKNGTQAHSRPTITDCMHINGVLSVVQ
ncbi:hypothetical protein CBL_12353 [Carabus blaptoides fortunei]